MSRRVRPLSGPFDGELVLPGSKSVANRTIVAAALAEGTTVIRNATPCDDVRHLVTGLQTLGFELAWRDRGEGVLEVRGGVPVAGSAGMLWCGNAGTSLRFLISLAALVPGTWTLAGDAHMARRPHGPLVAAWQGLGVDVEHREGRTPIIVHGGAWRGGTVELDAAISGQFLSSLLLVAPRLSGGLNVKLAGELASPDYVELTREVLERFGVAVTQDADTWTLADEPGRSPGEIVVEGDWSAAGAFHTLAAITGSRFRPRGVDPRSRQSDRGLGPRLARLDEPGEVTLDLRAMPDQALNLAVASACRPGVTTLTGLANLRHKECDRLAVMSRELTRLGARVEEVDDGLRVTGPTEFRRGTIDPEGDHRVAMAFAVLAATGVDLAIDDPGCVAKSHPGFFEDLDRVTRQPRTLAIVGARAAGKSALARALGAAIGRPVIDTDGLFEARRGSIGEFVASEGWPAFREVEAAICAESLLPPRVVALGGGAVETPAVRERLQRAIVFWIDEDAALRRERLVEDDARRPSLTGESPSEEIEAVDRRRRPWYAEVADLRLPPGETVARRCERVRNHLSHLARGGAFTAVES